VNDFEWDDTKIVSQLENRVPILQSSSSTAKKLVTIKEAKEEKEKTIEVSQDESCSSDDYHREPKLI
jgi:hypothetical protein